MSRLDVGLWCFSLGLGWHSDSSVYYPKGHGLGWAGEAFRYLDCDGHDFNDNVSPCGRRTLYFCISSTNNPPVNCSFRLRWVPV